MRDEIDLWGASHSERSSLPPEPPPPAPLHRPHAFSALRDITDFGLESDDVVWVPSQRQQEVAIQPAASTDETFSVFHDQRPLERSLWP